MAAITAISDNGTTRMTLKPDRMTHAENQMVKFRTHHVDSRSKNTFNSKKLFA